MTASTSDGEKVILISPDRGAGRPPWVAPNQAGPLAWIAAQLVAKQVVEELQPWIEREKAEHIKRAVAMGKRGYERIERLWDEREAVDPKQEQFASAALDKHDLIVRRNLGMSDNQPEASSLNLNILAGRGRTLIAIDQQPNQTPAQDQG
jgi:hypothetical protein